MEDDRLGLGVVILGQDHLLLDVGAADRGAVAVSALEDLPGADAVNPGDLLGVLLVGRAQDLTLVRPGGTQKPLEVETGHHVLVLPVAVVAPQPGIEHPVARRQDDRPYLHDLLLRPLTQIDCVVLADALADGALLVLEVAAPVIDVGDQRNGLREVDVDRLVVVELLVELVGDRDRAVLGADRTARADVLLDVPGLPFQGDLEVPGTALDRVDFRVGHDLDVGVPITFDGLRRLDAHRCPLDQEDLVAR